jgi:cytochrome P450
MTAHRADSTADVPTADASFDIGATDDSLERMCSLFAQLGDTYRVLSPARKGYVYVINHPEDARRVLVANHRNYTKGLGLDRVKLLLGNGIMTSEGEFWRRQRYLMQPAFHRRIIDRFGRMIAAANERLLERWQAAAGSDEPVNVTDAISELTLEIVLAAIFGEDLATLADANGDNPFAVVSREPARDLRFAYRFRSLGRTIAQLIERRRASGRQHFDFLAMLMAARGKDDGAPMTERELIDEVMTLVVAGHETTASALNWTWYLLARNPEAERRLHAEIDAAANTAAAAAAQVPPGPSGPPAAGLLAAESLHYVRQVCDEALRLYPPGWLLSRRTLQPDVLGGYEVPAGVDVLLSPYVLHRHPRYWQEPEEFRPERFAPGEEDARPRFAYIPFAAGPRHCIGESFALFEMVAHLRSIARHFRLRPVAEGPVEMEAQVNLRTRHPLWMRLERRR